MMGAAGRKPAVGGGGCDAAAIVCDQFTDTDGVLLGDGSGTTHAPDVDTEGGGWLRDVLNYEIQSNRLIVNVGLFDKEVILDTGVADQKISLGVIFDGTGDTGRWAEIIGRCNSTYSQR